MLTPLETGFGLEVVRWLQAHGSPLLDALALAIQYVGLDSAYLVLLIFLLLLRVMDRRQAYQWIFTLVVTTIATDVVKLAVRAPRPYQTAPQLVHVLVSQGVSFGLPSGHVSHAVAMFGLAAVWGGRRWKWILVAGFALLVAWARMYAGVHYPQDVIAGALVGLFSLWVSVRYFDRFMNWWGRIPLAIRVAIVLLGLYLAVSVPEI